MERTALVHEAEVSKLNGELAQSVTRIEMFLNEVRFFERVSKL